MVKGLGEDPAPVENSLRELKLTLENAQDMVENYASTNFMNRVLKAYKQRSGLFYGQSLILPTTPYVAVLMKPSIFYQDIREIKPEELIYDVPKEPFIKNSEIFKGEYNKFPVAIKRYTYSRSTSLSQVRTIFKKEVGTMKHFESPNILQMVGICVQEDSGPIPNFLIVMEFCEKGSLREVLDSQSDMLWDRKARMSLDAAQGVYRLHQSEEKFKVHGCINSSKFLVDARYRVKLAGFKLAQTVTSLKRTKDWKSSSLCYSSPQQLESINHPYNKACEMYRLVTQKEKYTEPFLEDCPQQLGELINDCRSYDSFYRPTAGVLVDKLRNVVEKLEED
ncbi:hypothetical protein J4Q44_G00117470 [Coregonus suidteri]|uniref:Protein kinase domain-containing protein n=1 Tax=Coregonus suidteri TaxID=861788 RepID=A0AAN8QZQ6_9TELE